MEDAVCVGWNESRIVRRKLKLVLFVTALLCAVAVIGPAFQSTEARAQTTFPVPVSPLLGPLKNVPVPEPSTLSTYVKNRSAAIALGKALFWDEQTGSDRQACASCHFNAGADSRTGNQINPGFRAIPSNNAFTPPFGANYRLRAADFPLHKLSDPSNHQSSVLFDTVNVVGSKGNDSFLFKAITPGSGLDQGTAVADPVFNVGGVNVRRVAPRNAPTVINAIYNFRNFWDGRARNEFNGVNPIGILDPTARILQASASGKLSAVSVQIDNASLASQAVGPPGSDVEMSFSGRNFRDIGRKMLTLSPLSQQTVHAQDSVLSAMSKSPTNGLKCGAPFTTCAAGGPITYRQMIEEAFQPAWWQSKQVVQINGTNADGTLNLTFLTDPGGTLPANQFREEEFNFSLFFGLAIQMYEATLRSDQTPFDAYASGNTSALTQQQQVGLDVFQNKGKCLECHVGAEFTSATTASVHAENKQIIERMFMGDANVAVYDHGFYNTSVRQCAQQPGGVCDDVGVGATIGPNNLPLSFVRYFQMQPNLSSAPVIPARPGIPAAPLSPTERVAVDGAFKTPGLRNVELTAPYFHNGGDLTLSQVVDFYDRGGNFPELNIANLDVDITPLGLTQAEKDALVAFMLSLTDERVRFEQAPFDHPSLTVPLEAPCSGTSGPCTGITGTVQTIDGVRVADQPRMSIPAVGSLGRTQPPSTFSETLSP
jgi:cytochrome c peroxidase